MPLAYSLSFRKSMKASRVGRERFWLMGMVAPESRSI